MNHTSSSFAIIPFAFGIVFGGFGLWNMVNNRRFRSRAIATAATIVGHELAYRGEDGTSYYTIVEFTVQDGTVTRGRTRRATSTKTGRMGSVATVYYDPADPARIDLSTRRVPVSTFTTSLLPLLFGLALIIVGFLILAGHITVTEENSPNLVQLGR